MAVFITVLSGTLVYVLGQIILKFFIEPIHELKKTIGVISHSLIERANIIYNPGLGLNDKEFPAKTSQELRNLASRLRSHLYLIPCYPWAASIFSLPAPSKIQDASKALIGLSNGVFQDKQRLNHGQVETVCNSLGIPTPD
jgi:hypothetical protein